MNSMAYDIAIVYRIYPGVSKSPAVFPNDKYRLSELCLSSFRASLGSLNVKMWVLLDACPDSYESLFRKYFNEQELELIRLDGIGNARTFWKQIDILSRQENSEYVYFAEDDYFYLPGQFPAMLTFLKENADADFVSPYDHPQHYVPGISNHTSQLMVFGQKHWRTSSSICLTFLTRRSTLREVRNVFATYLKGNNDSSMWMSLTKYGVRNPFRGVGYLISDLPSLKIMVKAWLYCWRQIVFGKRRTLWIPIPALATHMENMYMAPAVEWSEFLKSVQSKVEGEVRPHE
jgi:hypothetical protein